MHFLNSNQQANANCRQEIVKFFIRTTKNINKQTNIVTSIAIFQTLISIHILVNFATHNVTVYIFSLWLFATQHAIRIINSFTLKNETYYVWMNQLKIFIKNK